MPLSGTVAEQEASQAATPFLRWVGGKRQLTETLVDKLPSDVGRRRYVEPFLGAGSLFFAHAPESALLSDANSFLIATYEAIRDTPASVLRYLQGNISKHSEEYYYEIRSLYNRRDQSAAQAARFIYLNMTCFNGIFRVNRKGHFNVPKGSKDKLMCPTMPTYDAISRLLQKATIRVADFRKALALVGPEDFVYLDPPYPALNGTAYFTHYTSDRFETASQKLLARRVKALDNREIPFLMSNADVPLIRELYAGFRIIQLPVKRYVSCKGKRTAVMELLISNY